MEEYDGIIYEQPALYEESALPDEIIRVSWDELRKAPVGTEWSMENADRWPNANFTYETCLTKVFEDNTGCLIKKRDTDDGVVRLFWYEYF